MLLRRLVLTHNPMCRLCAYSCAVFSSHHCSPPKKSHARTCSVVSRLVLEDVGQQTQVAPPTTPTTTPTPTHHPRWHPYHAREWTHNTDPRGLGERGTRDAFATRRTEHEKRQLKDVVTPQMDIPKATVGEGSPAAGGVCLDAPSQWRGTLLSIVWIRRSAVRQGQSGGSVGTTKGKEGQVGR